MDTTAVYISIGNSDDKLTQSEWATFHALVNGHIDEAAHIVHGRWTSDTADPWQNACWCIELLDAASETHLRRQLALTASAFRQDSIAWAAAKTEFLAAIDA